MKKITIIVLATLALCLPTAKAQQSESGLVEIFCGTDLGYADTNWMRLYDVRIPLKPGMKWHMGRDWQFAFQGIIPIINEGYTFRDRKYEMIQVDHVVLSKQFHFDSWHQHVKLSAGLFGLGRWGGDLQWMMPVTDWLLLKARGGITRSWFLGCDMHNHSIGDFGHDWLATGTVGANVYLKPWNIEGRVEGGRYIAEDYGMQFDIMRHFSHCTIDLFYQLRMGDRLKSLVDDMTDRANGGFKVVMMIPPYKKSDHLRAGRVVFRPASNFRLTNNVRSDSRSMRTYTTDSEENERELNLDVNWGVRVSETLNKK